MSSNKSLIVVLADRWLIEYEQISQEFVRLFLFTRGFQVFDQESVVLASRIFFSFSQLPQPRRMAPFLAHGIDIILDLDNAGYMSEVVYERCGNFE